MWKYGGTCNLPPNKFAPALRIEELNYKYPKAEKKTLDNLNLTINKGERVALVGPNGAGKSTLIKLILGSDNLTDGSIEIFGHPASQCLHRVAVVPQRNEIDWNFPVTVRQVVVMGRYVHLGWFHRPSRRDRDIVDESMEYMQIADLAKKQVGQLSGGQQQRVMLARTLAHDADLLLLDEPLNHTDLSTQELIFHTLERLTERGKAVIVSTHDLGVLTVHFSRAIFLDKRIIADGLPENVLVPEVIAEAYGFQFHKDYTFGTPH